MGTHQPPARFAYPQIIRAPRSTPAEIVNRLNAEIAAVLGFTKIKARLVEVGATPFVRSPEDFRRFISDETERWFKVVSFAGIKPE